MAIDRITTKGILDGTIATADLADNAVTDAKSTITVTPAAISDTANTSTGAFDIPSGTTAQRPTSGISSGYTRYNTTENWVEVYTGSAWEVVGDQTSKIKAEYLVVGGGGPGASGGGGAGGVLHNYGQNSPLLLSSGTTYTATIGAGGTGTIYSNTPVDGTQSSLTGINISVVALGGGGGGQFQTNASTTSFGRDGGSGGGGGWSQQASTGGAGTAGQGNAGGSTGGITGYQTNGGGGRGAVGGTQSGNNSGNGGAGLQINIDGANHYYAGGGGGGAQGGSKVTGSGGIGGGGAGGGYNATGGAGTGGGSAKNAGGNGTITNVTSAVQAGGHGGANTGGGGGGDGQTVNVPGNGGSGIVIVRLPTADYSSTVGGTATTSGSDTIVTFTSSGTFTTAQEII